MLYFVGSVREFLGQLDQLAAGVHIIHVFNSYSQLFFRNVNARLDGEDHSWRKRGVVVARIVNIQTYEVSKAVDEIFTKGFAVEIFAVGVDIFVGDVVDGVGLIAAQMRFSGLKCGDGGPLCSQDNVVNLPLASRELS